MKIFLATAFCALILSSCNSPKAVKHSFFIAGHTYGTPNVKGKPIVKQNGLYPLFKEKIPFINKQNNIDIGFLLGDVVRTPRYWAEAEAEISKFTMPIHIARGNHDGELEPFKKRFGDTYKKFIHKNNLYIILDSNIDKWNISDDQLIFLMNALRIDGKKAKNIFIMVHNAIWYSEEKFKMSKPNSFQNKANKTNFWTKIEPLLRHQEKPVFIFAGDFGAFEMGSSYHAKNRPEYFYHNYDNITFVGTGMGGGVRDNFVIVDVHQDQSVSFKLIHLNGENIDGLGKLEHYAKEIQN